MYNECEFCGEMMVLNSDGLCKSCDAALTPEFDNKLIAFIYEYISDGVTMTDLAAGVWQNFGAVGWIDQLQQLLHSDMIVRIEGFGYKQV